MHRRILLKHIETGKEILMKRREEARNKVGKRRSDNKCGFRRRLAKKAVIVAKKNKGYRISEEKGMGATCEG